ncbi:MAG TPA: class I SAM-dependent methyltransferase, partial [Kofleriaceae bacterium]
MAPDQPTQQEYWNGQAAERWISDRERMDRSLESISTVVIERAAPRAGERVLDVGCGCGTTSLVIAGRVAPGGSVVGEDISAPMIETARGRAGGAPVEFLVADAATHRFGSPFDLLFSRFGVMFFAEPVAAFTNLRAQLAPGGRMAFVCWRSLRDNPWAFAPLAAARDLLPPMEPPDPHAPGPFAFADSDRLRGILTEAGFRDVAIDAHDDRMYTGANVEEATDHA